MSVKLRTRNYSNKAKGYYLDIIYNGQRNREFLNIVTLKTDSPELKKEKKDIAEAIAGQRVIEIAATGTVVIPKHKKHTDFIEYYRNYLSEYTKNDIRMIKYSLEKFVVFLTQKKLLKSGTFPVGDLTKRVCEDFRDYLKSDAAGLTGETPQNYFARFKKVLREATRDKLFLSYPAEDVIFKNDNDSIKSIKKQILDIDEIRALAKADCGNEQVKRAFLFACFTGLGIAEIRSLKWANFDKDRLKTNRRKTGSEVNIKLSDSALMQIGERGKSDEAVFNLDVSDVSISKALKNWVKRANIDKNISFYCGRHTYAVLLLNNGANLKTVADAMAHATTRHTIKYLAHTENLKDDATSNLPGL